MKDCKKCKHIMLGLLSFPCNECGADGKKFESQDRCEHCGAIGEKLIPVNSALFILRSAEYPWAYGSGAVAKRVCKKCVRG